MKENKDPELQYEWSLGSILFEKYLVTMDLSNEQIGIVGSDIICNGWEKVYFETEQQFVSIIEEKVILEDLEMGKIEAEVSESKWDSLDLKTILLYLVIIIAILLCGFMMVVY